MIAQHLAERMPETARALDIMVSVAVYAIGGAVILGVIASLFCGQQAEEAEDDESDDGETRG